MNSRQKRRGGGSGGGGNPCPVVPPPPCPTPAPKKPADPNDIRLIHGRWVRYATKCALFSRGNSKDGGAVSLTATGSDDAYVKLLALDMVKVTTAHSSLAEATNTEFHGILIHANEPNHELVLVRGDMDDDNAQWVTMDTAGNINISVGAAGSINLNAGDKGSLDPDQAGTPISSISISASGIKIKGPMVEIN